MSMFLIMENRLRQARGPHRFNYINTVLNLITVNSNTIEYTVHTSCYCASDLLCVTGRKKTSWSGDY